MSNADGYKVPNVDPATLKFYKATDSGDEGACVEIAHLPEEIGGVFLRHSKLPSEHTYFDRPEWAAFLAGAKRGEFDPNSGV